MNVASSVAIGLAERVERTGGPRAGLVAWRTLANGSTNPEVRGKALIAALRCALALRDLDALSRLTSLWETVDRGVWDAPITSLCKELMRLAAGDPGEPALMRRATELARVEARRHRTARSLYLHARCLDIAGDASAASAFRDAIDRAEKEGAEDIARSSRVRRAAILSRSWVTLSEALEEARQVELARVTPAFRLVLARVLLMSPSRFMRATAIGALDEIVVGDDVALASRALRTVAQWVDDVGDALTLLELDRLIALFGRERVVAMAPRAKEVMRTLDRIIRAKDDELDAALEDVARVEPLATMKDERTLADLHEHARDILRGRFEVALNRSDAPPADPARRRAFRYDEILDVAVAIRDRAPARAARSLRMLVMAEDAGERLPREVLGVAHAALVYDDPELREVAARFFELRLSQARPGAPPAGFLALADALAACGKEEAASLSRRAAAFTKEPGAAESLATSLARSGWEYARAGDRARAIEKLREAKALLESVAR